MDVVLFVGLFVILGVILYCALKESATTSLYKAFGVYGRLKAYLFSDILCAGAMMVVYGPILIINHEAPAGIGSIAGGIVFILIGMWIYKTTLNKCPQGLRNDLLKSMMISGMGVAAKIAVFFLVFVWVLTKPEEKLDSNGNKVYLIGGDVYDSEGKRIGKVSGYNEFERTID